jgi:hypothetical protein
MTIQFPEQRFIAREEFRERIQEEALAKPARAGEEAGNAFLRHAQGEGRLVDVVAIVLADFAEGLYADGGVFCVTWGAPVGKIVCKIMAQRAGV